MEERLDTLETRMMSVDDQLDELNRTAWRQQQEIDVLREHLRLLVGQFKTLQESLPRSPEDEIPPHW